MENVDVKLITNDDIEYVYKYLSIDDSKEEIKNGIGMITDGKSLYYVDGYNYPIYIRDL